MSGRRALPTRITVRLNATGLARWLADHDPSGTDRTISRLLVACYQEERSGVVAVKIDVARHAQTARRRAERASDQGDPTA